MLMVSQQKTRSPNGQQSGETPIIMGWGWMWPVLIISASTINPYKTTVIGCLHLPQEGGNHEVSICV